ncbi:uncharacterized protein LOC129766713 [Toxorhynchites rutilus septentrionalis]|uniref:uncharacterized protein LOC129766713 n=1 Tax=Toxorhynchites rutilus septentrionalis TaxID=329112 RepID=UPI00247AABE0|nr:uncharacterized protein LOC129766713 [Toxorhynchites rutilus septentrionalis]
MSTSRKYKALIRSRDCVINFVERMDHFLKTTQEFDEQAVKIRLEKLDQKYQEFEDLQSDIEGMEDNEESLLDYQQSRADFEDKYFEVRAGLARKLTTEHATPNTATTHTNNVPHVHASVRLPQINLPEFDGNFQNWLPFHDTYVALIDSSVELTDIQKFHYLRASLKGDALKMIDSYAMSEANYRVAWDSLVDRFSNKYLLKKRHLNALFEYPRIRRESATGLHELIDCFERNTKILDQLGEKTNVWGAMLVHLMVSKLDEVIQKRWEENVTPDREPSYASLVEFLKRQTRVLDAVSVDQQMFSTSSSSSSGSKFRPTKVSVNSATENSLPSCFACSEKHWITRCPTFASLPVDKRLQLTNSKRLCSNCLGRNHLARDCPSKFRCKTCSKKHHSLLHPGFPGSGSSSAPIPTPVNDNGNTSAPSISGGASNSGQLVSSSVASVSTNMAMGQPRSHSFLLTVLLNVKDVWGRAHHARALLDSGSQVNLMSENLCKLLQLSRRDRKVEITGIGRSRSRTAFEVSTTVSSRVQNFSTSLDFLVLGQVTDDQPSVSLPQTQRKIPPDMVLADPEFNISGPIDLVLGAQYFYDFHVRDGGRLQIRKVDDTLPVFVNTVFGWVAAGEAKRMDESTRVSCHVAKVESLDKAIEKFWTVEELTIKTPRSQEEEDCETHFVNTFTRDDTGRYIVRYPKRMNFSSMVGESKQTALRRFLQTEKRLERDPNLRSQYVDFMKEYIKLGHMKYIGEADDSRLDKDKTVCYLPHHPVFKESSSTTKVRVVFDGSAKTSTNHSLNEALLTGPTIQDELLDLMLRFRKHLIALVADVTKMYRQILIHVDDIPLQRILWRCDPSEPIQVYELLTVTYGLSPSSFLATRVLKQLALDSAQKYELAARTVQEDFYMDDFLSGANTVEEAIKLQKEVQSLLAEGGLELRKWSSNCPEVLENLPIGALGGETMLHFEADQKIKTLGVGWETGSDQLCIEVQPSTNEGIWTKRKIFSAIAKLYDPLGLVSPVVAWAKIKMQQLWLSTFDWDDPISDDIARKWEEFAAQLTLLKGYKVPRFVFLADSISTQFHIFTDASEVGYGACLYTRSTGKEGQIKTELVAAKSRVAPLKRLSLPRLELCAALLGAKLYAKVSAALRMEGIPCWFWSDSTVTLHWIQAPPNTWQTFVGNRTSEIQQLTHGHSWNHVKGTENPADHVSRGMLPQEFVSNTIWRHGPSWLAKSDEYWPKHITGTPPEDLLERRKTVLVIHQPQEHSFLFYRYSSFWRLVRIIALVLRFLNRCRRKPNPYPHQLASVGELEHAKETLTKIAQQEMFTGEFKELVKTRSVSNKSSLRLLGPFLDEKGIIRLGGRLEHSSENYQTKHPMILPKIHPLTRLITKHYHELCMHSGPRMTLATMRQEFWPVNGKAIVNLVCRKCPQCFRQNPVPVTQPVGQLPQPRTAPCRAFTVVGVDYCGPMYTKPAHRRAAPRKAYIAVFVCFASKAVHLELVCDLSTEAFIAALRRFIAHHGMPTEIHSDNGTNFQGANNTLAELYRLFKNKRTREAIVSECSKHRIQWHFIPPRAPSFGGLWEAAVKSAKTSLVKTLGNTQLSFQEYATVLAQIEANMNSRPLTSLSSDPTELDVLTPGHFLIGSPLISLPDPDYTHVPTNRLNHYQQLQKLIQQHWDRWRREYLTELNHQREKSSLSMDIRVGQTVLVQEDGKSSVSWPLARIEQIHPGADGVVRVATLRTASGTYKRPISRFFPLPYDNEPNDTLGTQIAKKGED